VTATTTMSHVRIHVIGGAGSGKTRFARELGRRIGIPVVELDNIAEQSGGYDNWFRPLCPVAKRVFDVRAIAATPAWISEGSFLWWTDALLCEAQLIVWLDPSLRTVLWRLISRHVREYVSEIGHQAGWKRRLAVLRHPHLAHLFRFVQWAWRYSTAKAPVVHDVVDVDDISVRTRAATERELQPHAWKVIQVTSANIHETSELMVRMLASFSVNGTSALEQQRRANFTLC
jgi:adenylate kinase family enzyme